MPVFRKETVFRNENLNSLMDLGNLKTDESVLTVYLNHDFYTHITINIENLKHDIELLNELVTKLMAIKSSINCVIQILDLDESQGIKIKFALDYELNEVPVLKVVLPQWFFECLYEVHPESDLQGSNDLSYIHQVIKLYTLELKRQDRIQFWLTA